MIKGFGLKKSFQYLNKHLALFAFDDTKLRGYCAIFLRSKKNRLYFCENIFDKFLIALIFKFLTKK